MNVPKGGHHPYGKEETGFQKMGNVRKKGVFALCDSEAAYAGRLMDFLGTRQGLPFEVQAFSSPEPLKEYARDHTIDLLLISESLMTEELTQIDVEKIMLLTEGEAKEEQGYPAACKYQPSESLLREILCCYETVIPEEAAAPWRGKNTRFYGVYSPVKRCGKTGFALMLGQVLAEEKRVLYLNFEEYAGFEILFQKQDSDISELLLHLLQGAPGMFRKLQELARPLGNMDYIPPGVRHADFLALTWEHWERLLTGIREEGIYDFVILDLGAPTDALLEILNYCGIVYIPVKDDPVSQAKLRQFFWVCDSCGYAALRERFREVRPPEENIWPYLTGKNLQAGELYGYVKLLLEQEEGDGKWSGWNPEKTGRSRN